MKHTQIRAVICAQGWGLFLPSVGQWSLLCTHALLVSRVQRPLLFHGEALADSTLYLFLCSLAISLHSFRPPPLKKNFFLFLCCFLEYQRENTERERDTEILHILYFVWSIGIFTFYSAYSYKETYSIMFLSWPILCELSWNYRFWSGVTLKQNAACRIS